MNDFNQMKLMKKELVKLRKEDKVPLKKANHHAKKEESAGTNHNANRPGTSNNTSVRARGNVNHKVRATKLRKM